MSAPSPTASPPATALKAKNKPGRKLTTTDPASKRIAQTRPFQNSAAQRAFRERKENAFKELQQKVSDLEQQLASARDENESLRLLAARLVEENTSLRSGGRTGNGAASAIADAQSKNESCLGGDWDPSATFWKTVQ
ncbi:DNA-binding transcription factor yap1 [Entophlyctis luteolus]|nr:DNA-binding transcription factor yap1 [Entophlyctis luteolus]